MPRPKNFARVAAELRSLQESLSSVVGQTKKLSQSLAGGLEKQLLSRIAVFEADVQRRIHDSALALSPMVELLSALGGLGGKAKPGRKPGRPKGSGAKPGPKPGRRKRGRRGVRVVLSAEQLNAAMSEAKGVKTRAADILGVSVPTLNKKLGEAGVAAKKRGRPGRPKKK